MGSHENIGTNNEYHTQAGVTNTKTCREGFLQGWDCLWKPFHLHFEISFYLTEFLKNFVWLNARSPYKNSELKWFPMTKGEVTHLWWTTPSLPSNVNIPDYAWTCQKHFRWVSREQYFKKALGETRSPAIFAIFENIPRTLLKVTLHFSCGLLFQNRFCTFAKMWIRTALLDWTEGLSWLWL